MEATCSFEIVEGNDDLRFCQRSNGTSGGFCSTAGCLRCRSRDFTPTLATVAKLAQRDEAPTRKEFLARTKAMKKASKAEPKSKKQPGPSLKKKASNQPTGGPKTKPSVQPARFQQAPAVIPNGLAESEDDHLYVGTVVAMVPRVSSDALMSCTRSSAFSGGALPHASHQLADLCTYRMTLPVAMCAYINIYHSSETCRTEHLACVIHPVGVLHVERRSAYLGAFPHTGISQHTPERCCNFCTIVTCKTCCFGSRMLACHC